MRKVPIVELADAEAFSVDIAAKKAGVGRVLLYRAINDDAEYRRGLPLLPSIKVGKRRLIRPAALRAWLASLEKQAA